MIGVDGVKTSDVIATCSYDDKVKASFPSQMLVNHALEIGVWVLGARVVLYIVGRNDL